jgi:hypothetical protein
MKGLTKEATAPVPRFYYCDESSNEADDPRIGVAMCSGSKAQWDTLAGIWPIQMMALNLKPDDFHATRAKEEARMALANTMQQIGIATACATLRISDFEKGTKQADRGKYGGAYGFVRYMLLLHTSWAADDLLDETPIEIYIDQGGLGGDWFMQLLDAIAMHDSLRKKYRLTAHRTVDRRNDVRVHCPDLISHELLTDRHTSPVLKLLGNTVLVDDWTQDGIAEAIDEFNDIREWIENLEKDAKKHAKDKAQHS